MVIDGPSLRITEARAFYDRELVLKIPVRLQTSLTNDSKTYEPKYGEEEKRNILKQFYKLFYSMGAWR